jgi:uncharacterized protein
VNMLIALMDPKHVHHTRARAWWQVEKDGGWASCPMTENGFLRIVTLKGYTNPFPLPDALAMLRRAVQHPKHVFWPDDLSLLDPDVVEHTRLLGSRQITDVYLFALAVRHGGRLVTLDAGISASVVRGATPDRLVVV